MNSKRWVSLFDGLGVTRLYSGYYGVTSLGVIDGESRLGSGFLKATRFFNMLLSAVLRRLPESLRIETRVFSPYLIYIAHRRRLGPEAGPIRPLPQGSDRQHPNSRAGRVRFLVPLQGIDTDQNSPTGPFTLDLLAAVAEWERSSIVERRYAGQQAYRAAYRAIQGCSGHCDHQPAGKISDVAGREILAGPG